MIAESNSRFLSALLISQVLTSRYNYSQSDSFSTDQTEVFEERKHNRQFERAYDVFISMLFFLYLVFFIFDSFKVM